MLLAVILFALALSLDCFGVGISYGLQGIRIAPQALLVICGCSGMTLAISMLMGQLLAQVISPYFVQYLGAGILIMLGLFLVIKNSVKIIRKAEGTLWEVPINCLGIVIRILKEPAKADMDRSGEINCREAFLLGLALSLDSFAAGIGAALIGLPTGLTSMVVGVAAFLFVSLGSVVGQKLGDAVGYNKLGLFPGMILILVGLSRLFF